MTVIPGEYTGRSEHIHVKVNASGGPVLTTQPFFPGVSTNAGDGIFSAATLGKDFKSSGSAATASVTFVVKGG